MQFSRVTPLSVIELSHGCLSRRISVCQINLTVDNTSLIKGVGVLVASFGEFILFLASLLRDCSGGSVEFFFYIQKNEWILLAIVMVGEVYFVTA